MLPHVSVKSIEIFLLFLFLSGACRAWRMTPLARVTCTSRITVPAQLGPNKCRPGNWTPHASQRVTRTGQTRPTCPGQSPVDSGKLNHMIRVDLVRLHWSGTAHSNRIKKSYSATCWSHIIRVDLCQQSATSSMPCHLPLQIKPNIPATSAHVDINTTDAIMPHQHHSGRGAMSIGIMISTAFASIAIGPSFRI